jgi:hypothetical protein
MLRRRIGFTEQVRQTVYGEHAPSSVEVPLKPAQSSVTAA